MIRCRRGSQLNQHRGRRKLERTKDHLIPVSRGGPHGLRNIVVCHRKCNEDKANRTLEEYRAVVSERKGIPVEQFRFPGELHG